MSLSTCQWSNLVTCHKSIGASEWLPLWIQQVHVRRGWHHLKEVQRNCMLSGFDPCQRCTGHTRPQFTNHQATRQVFLVHVSLFTLQTLKRRQTVRIINSKNGLFLPGYLPSLESLEGKKRYKENLALWLVVWTRVRPIEASRLMISELWSTVDSGC